MQLKKSTADDLWYYVLCIFSMGAVFLFRVVITNAIQQALQDKEK